MANIATGRPDDSSASGPDACSTAGSDGSTDELSDGFPTGLSGKKTAFRFGDTDDSKRSLR
jgi:hypothetical protein